MTSRARAPGPAGVSSKTVTDSRSESAPTCRQTWDVDLSWTKFGGAGRYNDLNDRDFVAATLKVAF